MEELLKEIARAFDRLDYIDGSQMLCCLTVFTLGGHFGPVQRHKAFRRWCRKPRNFDVFAQGDRAAVNIVRFQAPDVTFCDKFLDKAERDSLLRLRQMYLERIYPQQAGEQQA